MEFDEEQYIVPRRIPKSIRSSMEFDEKQNIVLGRIPKCGAIFMSNSATKRECYRRGLFGLPSSQGHFVKQVKAGMILFLFEYERRQLHGVFQACSDGAMNIVPHAFTSSRMQFPAQVKFTPIWDCSPLTENEFHDAIKENYFSSNKFNFGLSEDQVRRLLRLFSFRKLADRPPQRQLKKSKVTPIEYSRAKVRREVDDGGFVMNDKVKDVHDAHDNSRPIILTDEYPRESFGNVGRVIDDGRFAENHGVGNKPNEPGPVIPNEYLGDYLGKVGRDEGGFAVRDKAGSECNLATEHGPVMSNDYPEYHLGKIGQVIDDVRFATSNRLGSEQNMDNSFVSPILTGYPCLFRSNRNESPYFSKPIQATESVIQDKLRQPSSFCGTTEPQTSNPFYSTYFEDANAMNTLPYDPENASINFRRSSSFEIDHSTNSGQECPPHTTYFGTSIPSLKKQSYMPSVELNGINRFPGSSSGCGNHVPFPTPNRYEHSRFTTSMPLSGSAFSENLATDSSKNQSYGCLSFPESSLPPVPYTKIGNNGLENKVVSSYSSSPSIYPSYVYGVASQDKAEHEAARQENNEAFTANFPLSNEGQVQLQGLEDSFEPRNVNYHEHKSFNHDVNQYQTSENGFYGCQKNRNSVFSRLSLASDVYVYENGIDVGNEECDGDTSVDEVMAMLHQSHNQWEKTQKYKPLIKRHDHVVNFRNKKQTTFCSKLERDWLEMNLEEIKMNSTATIEQNVNQIAETCFVDFKRRSEVRKVHDDTKTRGCDEIAGSDGLSGGQLKRRKLIRPDFSKKESSDDKGINDDVSSNIEVSSDEGSVSKDKTGSCEVFIRSLDKENKLFESVELPHVICPISHKKISAEGGSNCKGELKAESCEKSFRPRGIDGKESSQDFDIENHCKDKSHNAEEHMGIKDPVVHGVSQGCIDTSHSIMQQSFSEVQEENAEKGTLCVETELGIGNTMNSSSNQNSSLQMELLQSVEKVSELCPTRGEIAIGNMMNSSSNQNSSSQMELLQSVEKVSELCPTSGEIAIGNTTELLQSVEKVSELCPSSGEIAIGNKMNNSSSQTSTLQMELLQNVKKGSELCPTSGELSIGNTMNSSSNQHSTLQIDLLQSVEKVSELCPTSGEIAIGKTTNSSRNQNSTLQMMPEEPVCVFVDEGKRTSGSSTKQSEASLENVR